MSIKLYALGDGNKLEVKTSYERDVKKQPQASLTFNILPAKSGTKVELGELRNDLAKKPFGQLGGEYTVDISKDDPNAIVVTQTEGFPTPEEKTGYIHQSAYRLFEARDSFINYIQKYDGMGTKSHTIPVTLEDGTKVKLYANLMARGEQVVASFRIVKHDYLRDPEDETCGFGKSQEHWQAAVRTAHELVDDIFKGWEGAEGIRHELAHTTGFSVGPSLGLEHYEIIMDAHDQNHPEERANKLMAALNRRLEELSERGLTASAKPDAAVNVAEVAQSGKQVDYSALQLAVEAAITAGKQETSAADMERVAAIMTAIYEAHGVQLGRKNG